MSKIVLIIFICFYSDILGQNCGDSDKIGCIRTVGLNAVPRSKRDIQMDSISMSKFSVKVQLASQKSAKGYRPVPKVKITFKTRLNLKFTDSTALNEAIQEIEDNLIGVMKYDIRCKVYLTQKLSITSRALIDDNRHLNRDMYSLGLTRKF
mgnify:CR=1 FL=1